MGALLRAIRAPQVAEARAPAPSQVHGELSGLVSRRDGPLLEEPVVLVDLPGRQLGNVVLIGVLSRTEHQVFRIQSRDTPGPDHSLRWMHRGSRVHQRGSPIGLPDGQGHGSIRSEEPSPIEIESVGHLQLMTVELGILKARPFLQDQHSLSTLHQGDQGLSHGSPPGTRSHDCDVGGHPLHDPPSPADPEISGFRSACLLRGPSASPGSVSPPASSWCGEPRPLRAVQPSGRARYPMARRTDSWL